MSRWHDAGCKQPVVTVFDDTPCCTYCFAFASASRSAHNIMPVPSAWSVVSETGCHDDSNHQLGFTDPVSDDRKTRLFPDIKPQEQLRLLRVSSRHSSSPIHLHIETVRIRDSLSASYDILSYARLRGTLDQVDWRLIYIGRYWDIAFIPKQYEELLQAVRREDTDRHVWMECLCVDGANAEERTCQAILAPQILSNATRTLMCLASESNEKYDKAITLLRSLESSGISVSCNESVSSQHSKLLRSFLQHDYFTTIQAIREVVLSKSSTLIYQGMALSWTETLSERVTSHASAPQWLRGPAFRYNHTARDTLSLLLEVSSYFCRDDRDRVFVLLALFHMGDAVIDYGTRMEKVFADVATYLIKQNLFFETISIAATREKPLNLPSWVPCWNKISKVNPNFALEVRGDFNDVDVDDESWDGAIPVEFVHLPRSNRDVTVDASIGRLTVSDMYRLCATSGAVVENQAQSSKVQIDSGPVGVIIITCAIESYKPGLDFLFLSPTMRTPVVLRYHPEQESYSIVCTCTVGRGFPIRGDESFCPWNDPTLDMSTIRVSRTRQHELDLMQEFHADLREVCRSHSNAPQQEEHPPATASPERLEALMLDLALLTLTGLLETETTLIDHWNRLDSELGWLFLDQDALSSLLLELDIGLHEPASGHSTLSYARSYFAGCGVDLPLTYDWNLSKFCSSFVTRPVNTSTSRQHQSPVLSLLKSHFPKIREWALISAQLFLLFGFSNSVFEKSWPSFPGSSLAEEWQNGHWIDHDGISPFTEYRQLKWDWTKFRAALQLRSDLWNHSIPQELRLTVNTNLATKFSMRCLGLNLTHHESIEID